MTKMIRISRSAIFMENQPILDETQTPGKGMFLGRGGARKLQKGNMWRLRCDDAPAEWGGYNERKRDRHALRCSHVTLLTCSYLPHAVRALIRFCNFRRYARKGGTQGV